VAEVVQATIIIVQVLVDQEAEAEVVLIQDNQAQTVQEILAAEAAEVALMAAEAVQAEMVL
jgi:hypothetical protein